MKLHLYSSGLENGMQFTPNPSLHSDSGDALSIDVMFNRDDVHGSQLDISHLVLLVPRDRVEIFTTSWEKSGNPGAHISVSYDPSGTKNDHFSIQCFFGSLNRVTEDGAYYEVDEDPFGWAGSSDLIVTCAIPSPKLVSSSLENAQISMAVNKTWLTSTFDWGHGADMIIYSCAFTDTEHVLLLKTAPSCGERGQRDTRTLPNANQIDGVPDSSASKDHQPSITSLSIYDSTGFLTVHDSLSKDSEESAALALGAQVVASQSSPCTMRLFFQILSRAS